MKQLPSLRRQKWLKAPDVQRVLAALGDARIAGGAVRNALLGEPVADIDIATPLSPQDVMEIGEKSGFGVHPTGLAHGTVTLTLDKKPFEVTTLRHDVETDGRRAKVAFTSDWAADAMRRDFTMNALYCDANGKIFDFVGGYGDVLRKRVRFVGAPSARIREDYLRILRFFRFHARYGKGPPDKAGLTACARLRKGLTQLSAERVRQELFKLLVAARAVPTLEIMQKAGILRVISPLLCDIPGLKRMAAIDDKNRLAPDPLLRLQMLSGDARPLADKLRLTRKELSRLEGLGRHPPPTPKLREHERRAILHAMGEECWRDSVRIAWARSRAPLADKSWRDLLRLPDKWQAPVFPVKGADLVAAGVKPGPEVGRILSDLEDWWVAAGFKPGKDELIARLGQFKND
ncbi:MAG: CCA tRNA nucleotidyltransferase [Rhizobiales bacterium]|nr:CCA tRNA nucleotidyltransferase [Hyphomicrobiales bacterium]